MKRQLLILTLAIATGATFAQTASPPAPNPVDGEVRKIDIAAKKITIKHGEIKSLDMPGMTMVFQVVNPADLEQLKPGDKVRFKAERGNGGAFIASEIKTTAQ